MNHVKMRQIKFHTFGKDSIVRRLIAARFSSAFSHTAIQFDNDLYESTMLGGVKCLKNTYPTKTESTIVVTVSEESYQKALAEAKKHVGKGYDYRAILGFVMGTMYQDKGALFCSEYGRLIYQAATGFSIKRYNLTSPGLLRAMIASHQDAVVSQGH